MRDDLLLRYNRQIMLPEIEIAGQQKISDAHAVIVGLGGLGSPVAMYLASAGVGKLTLIDFDRVDLSNLQRQIAHSTDDIDTLKVESAKNALLGLNPEIIVEVLNEKLEPGKFDAHIAQADIVLDCSDNFETRYLLNELAIKYHKPLVSGAALGFEGQISVFDLSKGDSPCYRCLYSDGGERSLSCSENGVLGPLVGIIGSMQALEAIKVIVGFGQPLVGKLLVFDALAAEWRSLKLKKDPQCASCK